jgi:hypothetical protein
MCHDFDKDDLPLNRVGNTDMVLTGSDSSRQEMGYHIDVMINISVFLKTILLTTCS